MSIQVDVQHKRKKNNVVLQLTDVRDRHRQAPGVVPEAPPLATGPGDALGAGDAIPAAVITVLIAGCAPLRATNLSRICHSKSATAERENETPGV